MFLKMRYGHCKNCWWWLNGICYFQMVRTMMDYYCPDYHNRKKDKEKLIDWIIKNDITFEN